jgi:hypothetical protein
MDVWCLLGSRRKGVVVQFVEYDSFLVERRHPEAPRFHQRGEGSRAHREPDGKQTAPLAEKELI